MSIPDMALVVYVTIQFAAAGKRGMTWVDLKRLDEKIDNRITILISSKPGGLVIDAIHLYFTPRNVQKIILQAEMPEILNLADQKRGQRVQRVINRMIKEGRARIGRRFGVDTLEPLTALDRIVHAIDESEQADRKGRDAKAT